jgi:hypothetical protein
MTRLACFSFAAILLAGCTAPRYQIAVTSVQSRSGTTQAEWLAVRVDQKTGTSWYALESGDGRDVRWRPVLEWNETAPGKARAN